MTIYVGRQHGNGGSQPKPQPLPSPRQPKRVAPSRPNPRRKPGRKNPQRGNPAKPGPQPKPGPGPNPGGPRRPVYIPPFKPAPGPGPGPKPGPQKWTANPAWKRGKIVFEKAARVVPWIQRGMDFVDFYNNMDNLQAYFQFHGKEAIQLDLHTNDYCHSYYEPFDVPSIECGFRLAGAYGSAYYPCEDKHTALVPPSFDVPGSFVGFFNPSFVTIGPLRGGIAGCERLSGAHVWVWNRPSNPDLWTLYPRRRIQPVPDVKFEPALDPLGVPDPYPYRQPPRVLRQPGNRAPAVSYHIRPHDRKHPRRGPDHGFHFFERPPKGVREKKWRIADNGLLAGLSALYGGFTELEDFLDGMASGLPEPLRKEYFRKRTLQDKGNYLVDHADQVDVRKGVEAWLQDRARDKAHGRLARDTARNLAATGYWVSPRGPGISRAGWSGPHQPME